MSGLEPQTKLCQKCNEQIELTQFSKRSISPDGLNYICKNCRHANYQNNIVSEKDSAIRTAQFRRALLNKFKDQHCNDCGIKYPPYVMDFDHKGDKDFTIGLHKSVSLKKLLLEIAKCDIVCSNCHRERTHKRRQDEEKITGRT